MGIKVSDDKEMIRVIITTMERSLFGNKGVFPVEAVFNAKPETKLSDLHDFDSIDYVDIIMGLDKRFHVDLGDDDKITDKTTFADVIASIRRQL